MRDALLQIADAVLSVGLLKGTLFACLAAGGIALTRRGSASVRATVWGAAVVTLVALPVLWKVVPWWQLGVLAFPQPLFSTDSALAAMLRLPALQHDAPPALWLGVVWAIGALILAANFARQRIGVELLARAGEPAVNDRIAASAARLCRSHRIRRPVRVVYSESASSPYAFGWRRATVVMPCAARAWSDEQVDAILRHELAHVARGDYLLLLIGELARVLYWPNPAVWFALAALRRSQDAACDDRVLRGGVPAAQYARHLLAVARSSAAADGGAPRIALSLLGRCDLRERVRAILDRASDRRSVSKRALTWGAAAMCALAVTIASADPWICPVTASERVGGPLAETAGERVSDNALIVPTAP